MQRTQVKDAINEELQTMPPSAKSKLVEKNNNVNKLTKKDIFSLLLTCFAVKEDANKKRQGDLVVLLSMEIEAHPDKML
jgi:hypothetical protein